MQSPPLFFRAPRHVLCSVCARKTKRPAATADVLNLQPTSEGVLPGQLLERAIRAGYIDAGRFNIPDSNVQPASLDLRLGERALRIRCSFLPGTDSVERKLKDYILDEIDLRGDGAMLEARCPYLIELKERLDLPAGLRGKANPKSSTGRIDVFTRVITDNSDRFDEVAPGYSGPLYLEVVPLSFAVRVREDLTLNQLRLSIGRPWLSDDEVRQTHLEEPILYKGGSPVPVDDLVLSNGLFLGLDLRGDERGQVGHSTRDSAPLLDLTVGGGGRSDAVLGSRLPRGRRPPGAVAQALLSLDVERGGEHSAQPGGRNDGLRPDQRRTPDALRRVLRSRASGSIRREASGARARRSKCAPTTCRSWWRTARPSASSPSSGCSKSRPRCTGRASDRRTSNKRRR